MWPFNRKKDPLKAGIFEIVFLNPIMVKPKKRVKVFNKLTEVSKEEIEDIPLGTVFSLHRRGFHSLERLRKDFAGEQYITGSIDTRFILFVVGSDLKKAEKVLKKTHTAFTVNDVTSTFSAALGEMKREKAEMEIHRSVSTGVSSVKLRAIECDNCGEDVLPDSDADCPECGYNMLNCFVDMDKSIDYYMKKGKVKLYAA